MNSFRRLSITLTSRMNAMIDQLENHEAVADSVLEDIRRAVTSIRYQIKRIHSEEQQLERRLETMQADHSKWKDRALRSEASDREKALECVRRVKKLDDEIASVKTQIAEHSNLQRQLSDQLKQIESRYTDLKRKQSLLIGRESRAEAIQHVSRLEADGCCGDGIFERWERKVMRTEAAGECYVDPSESDKLSESFDSEEERKELEVLLDEMKHAEKK